VKDSNINLRLDPDLKRRVDVAADTLGVNPSALMRMLLARFLTHCERHNGRIVMPPEFKDYDIREAARSEPLRHAADAGPEYGTRKKGAKP
jgi:hypothetical protein